MVSKKLVHGVGVNDADYTINRYLYWRDEDNKLRQKRIWICPYYIKWANMLKRVYCEKYQIRYPTYVGCTVDVKWLLFSNFKKYLVSKEEFNTTELGLSFGIGELHLDKDFLCGVNSYYSEDNCVLIHENVNQFIKVTARTRGEYMIGVKRKKPTHKFVASCSNLFTKSTDRLGSHTTEMEAHLAWKARKHELATQLANSEYVWDERVRQRLLTMYAPDTDWTNV